MRNFFDIFFRKHIPNKPQINRAGQAPWFSTDQGIGE